MQTIFLRQDAMRASNLASCTCGGRPGEFSETTRVVIPQTVPVPEESCKNNWDLSLKDFVLAVNAEDRVRRLFHVPDTGAPARPRERIKYKKPMERLPATASEPSARTTPQSSDSLLQRRSVWTRGGQIGRHSQHACEVGFGQDHVLLRRKVRLLEQLDCSTARLLGHQQTHPLIHRNRHACDATNAGGADAGCPQTSTRC